MSATVQLPLFVVPIDDDEALAPDVARRFFTMAGRCSGIPECCIAHFIEIVVDRSGYWPDELDVEATGYRRCPRCLADGTVVPVRRCPMRPCACNVAKAVLFTRPRNTRVAWLALAERWLVGSGRP